MPAIKDTISTNYYSGQGNILVSKRDTSGKATTWWMLGNAPKADVKFTVERRKHKESRSGQRLIDKVQTVTKGGTLELTLEDIRKDNVALYVMGKRVTQAGSTVTNEVLPALVAGSIVKLAKQNVTALTIKDSAATPVTLTLNTHYRILDADWGLVEILSLPIFVAPIKADYTSGSIDVVTALEGNDDDEYEVYIPATNTEGEPDDQKIGFHIYRVVFNPTDLISLINEEQAQFNITAEILRDGARATNSAFGGFARWEYIDVNSTTPDFGGTSEPEEGGE